MHVAVEQFAQKCTESVRLIRVQEALKCSEAKLVKYMDYSNKYFHKIWGQSHEQFVQKGAASAKKIRKMEIQRIMTKS